MIIDCAHYLDGRRQNAGAIPLEEAAAKCALGGFVWLGMFEPRPDELEQVRESFGLHELAVEDAVEAHQRPKLERYGETLFMVLRPARYVDETETVVFGEVAIFVGRNFVITVRHGEARDLGHVRRALEARPQLLDEFRRRTDGLGSR